MIHKPLHNPHTRILVSALILIMTMLAYARTVQSQPSDKTARPEIVLEVREWQKNLDELEKRLAKSDLDEYRLSELQKSLDTLRLNIRIAAEKAQPEVKVVQDDLSALGKPPAEGEPPESASVAARRQLLNQQLALAEGGIKEAELVINKADRLAMEVSGLRRSRFTTRLLTPGLSPLHPLVWETALMQSMSIGETARLQGQQISAHTGFNDAIKLLGSKVLAMLLLAGLSRQALKKRLGRSVAESPKPRLQRLAAIARITVLETLIPLTICLTFAQALYGDSYWPDTLAVFVGNIALVLSGCWLIASFGQAIRVTAPSAESPRIRTTSRLITSLFALWAIDWLVGESLEWLGDATELILLEKFVVALGSSVLLLRLLYPNRMMATTPPLNDGRWLIVRRILTFTLAIIPLAGFLGYVPLARLMALQWALTASLYVTLKQLLLHGSDAIESFFTADSSIGTRLRQTLELSEDGADLLAFWTNELFRLTLLIVGGIGLLMVWGVGGSDLATWLYKIFFGFRIGQLSFSLANLLWALLVIVVLLTITRLLQRTLDTRVFPKTRWDTGIRHSIRSAIGYLGFIIATLSAMSSLGLDMSNLAIIAGALSVGIGFGMQNIVNNFVSGLILLVERPIKVGDWVVVGEFQGYVRKISVRATEITTFDRASVFIPNSSLISGNVMNRTHADKVGRVLLPLGVPHGVNAKRVRTLLLEIVRAHPEVRRNPAPFVVLKGFGESTLNFELFAFINDVDNVLSVTSDLCFEIDEVFRAEGIELPNPQKDIRLSFNSEQMQTLLDTLKPDSDSAPQRQSPGG